jgi:hypothetical protein
VGNGDPADGHICPELAQGVRLLGPPVSLVMQTIRKIAITAISGVLIIPLWKNAKFWTFAFRDGIHLNSMFDSVQIVPMHTLAWEFSKKDVIGGKENQLLVIKIGSVRGV